MEIQRDERPAGTSCVSLNHRGREEPGLYENHRIGRRGQRGASISPAGCTLGPSRQLLSWATTTRDIEKAISGE